MLLTASGQIVSRFAQASGTSGAGCKGHVDYARVSAAGK
jgi:hypothetical protein